MGYTISIWIAYTIVILGIINLLRIMFLMVGSDIYNLMEYIKRKNAKRIHSLPTFTVLIPAHNETNTIISSVRSVVRAKYPKDKIQIIVVDDGSTDNTVELLKEYHHRYHIKNLLVISQPNQGKAHALNNALRDFARGELVMCLDADSSIDPNALLEAAKYFRDPRVVAMAANVKIRPLKTVLNFAQRLEYLISYQFKRALTQFNIEYIVGGIGSVFRLSALKQVGLYDTNTITEDIDLTMKLLKLGNKDHRVIYGPRVIAFTESVLDIAGLIRQRYRWKYGRTQTFLKNPEMFFNVSGQHSNALTWLFLPYIVFTDLIYFLEPLLTAYLVGASIYYRDITTVVSAFLVMTIYIVMNVLAEDTVPWKERFRLAVLAPSMYFLFYIISYIDYVALIKSAFNFRKIWNSVQEGSEAVCGWEHVERQKI